MKGYIFVNELGEYAIERANTGFGSGTTVVCWTKDINAATVFNNEEPWTGCMGRHLKAMSKAQPLQAELSRVVTLGRWKEAKTDGV